MGLWVDAIEAVAEPRVATDGTPFSSEPEQFGLEIVFRAAARFSQRLI